MKAFKIISKLTPAESQRLRRYSKYVANSPANLHPQRAFVWVARNTYRPLYEEVSVHEAARHAMVVAGRTFDYEIKEAQQ